MASITSDPNGRKRIQFFAPDGKRKTIRLGKLDKRNADKACHFIEDLASAVINRSAPHRETSDWVANIPDNIHAKLAKAGLVEPRNTGTLAAFTQSYIDSRCDIKESTRSHLLRSRSYLLECFDGDRDLRSFNAADAQDFRLHMIKSGRAENTGRRAIGRARQFFKAAMNREMIRRNPFEGIAASVKANTDKFYFVRREDAQKVIDHCPDDEWRLIFILARYGGLRCPSELLALKWTDINFGENRMRIPSPKTAAYEGKASRMIPIFPELQKPLFDAFTAADDGSEYVISKYRSASVNLRTHLTRIIQRAGLEPWPKLFQNLRSTRETELAGSFPLHVVVGWIGNSEPVAAKHYLQITDEHFKLASKQTAQKAAQTMQEEVGNDWNGESEDCDSAELVAFFQDSQHPTKNLMPPPGLEQVAQTSGKTGDFKTSGAKCGAVDADLANLMAKWGDLPAAIRKAITAMINTM